jgi:FkbM family methyltransferase
MIKIFTKNNLRKFLNKKNIFYYTSVESRNYHTINFLREKIISTTGGVLHIGAHEGQEASQYSNLKVRVMWVEAIPEIFKVLSDKISTYPNQKAICALLGSKNADKVRFYLSSNESQSSSIYRFGNDIRFTDLEMVNSIVLRMKKLSSLFTAKTISIYPHWVIDVQGAELEVLKGAGKLLDHCYSAEIEVTSRNLYAGGANAKDVINFMRLNGFIILQEHKIGSHEDLLFIRVKSRQ